MKSTVHRSSDYGTNLQGFITSTKLLQDASESSTGHVPSGALLSVAMERLEEIKALKTNHDVGEELAEKIVHQVGTIFHEISRPTPNEDTNRLVLKSVERYTAALTEVHDALTKLTQRGKLGTSLMRGRDRRELQGLTVGIDTEFIAFMKIIGKQPSRSEFRRSGHINPTSPGDFSTSPPNPSFARANSPSPSSHGATRIQHIRCWPGTRVPILDEINHWATASAQSPPSLSTSANTLIYWLADIPGSGKSVIAADLSDEWRDKGILGGYYDAGSHGSIEDDGDGVDPICQAWAEQLGSAFPELTTSILRALSEVHRSPTTSRGFQQQFKLLILGPLKQLRRDKHGLSPQAKIIFVLDAVDEYPTHLRVPILQGIKSVGVTFGIKFLLVSRLPTTEEDADLMEELLEAPSSLVTRGSINIHSASNMADLLLYLTAQFQLHAAQFHSHPQFRSALIDPTIRVLAKRSEGLMLWTKVAFEMLLAADNPTRMLLNLVEEDSLGEMFGLYLELVLMAQTKLDKANDALASTHKNTSGEEERDQSGLWPPGSPGNLGSSTRESYPRNAIAMILSAVGYSKESLSVWTIAELTGLGLERTMNVLHLLTISLDYGQPSMAPRSPLLPLPPLPDQRSRGSKMISPSSFHSIPSKKRSMSNARTSSFSPARRKMSNPDAPRPSNVSAAIEGFSPIDGKPAPSLRSRSREKGVSIDLPHLGSPSPLFSSLALPGAAAEFAKHSMVKVRHSTFRDWIRLPHPPTLLSCLTGKTVMEEDDLRFVVAPTRESAHGMLAKGCLGIIRGSSPSTGDGDTSPIDARRSASASGEDTDSGHEDVAYASRHWAYHCAQLLETLSSEESNMYMASISSGGNRWKGIRGDLLEFFTRKLLWWVDYMNAQSWAEEGLKGLRALRDVLQAVKAEEELETVVGQLVQWTLESTRLLEKPPEISSIPENERNSDASLVWKYYGDELTYRAALVEQRSQPKTSLLEQFEEDELLPPPPLFNGENVTPGSTPSRSSFALPNRAQTPKLAESSVVGVASLGTEKAASTFTRATRAGDEADAYRDETLNRLLAEQLASQDRAKNGIAETNGTDEQAVYTAQQDEKSLPDIPDPSEPSLSIPAQQNNNTYIPSARPISLTSSEMKDESTSPITSVPPPQFSSPLFPSLSMFSSKFAQAPPAAAVAKEEGYGKLAEDRWRHSVDSVRKEQEPVVEEMPVVAALDFVQEETEEAPALEPKHEEIKTQSLEEPVPLEMEELVTPSQPDHKLDQDEHQMELSPPIAHMPLPVEVQEAVSTTTTAPIAEEMPTPIKTEEAKPLPTPPSPVASIPEETEAIPEETKVVAKAPIGAPVKTPTDAPSTLEELIDELYAVSPTPMAVTPAEEKEQPALPEPEQDDDADVDADAPVLVEEDVVPPEEEDEPPALPEKVEAALSSPVDLFHPPRRSIAPESVPITPPKEPSPVPATPSTSTRPALTQPTTPPAKVQQPPEFTPISPVKGKEKGFSSFKKMQKSIMHKRSKEHVKSPKEKEKELTVPVKENIKPNKTRERALSLTRQSILGRKFSPSAVPTSTTPPVIPSTSSPPSIPAFTPTANEPSPFSIAPTPSLAPVLPAPSFMKESSSTRTTPTGPPTPAKEISSFKDEAPPLPAKPATAPGVSPESRPPTDPKPPVKNTSKPRYQPVVQTSRGQFDSPITKNVSPLFPSLSMFSVGYGYGTKEPIQTGSGFSTGRVVGRAPPTPTASTGLSTKAEVPLPTAEVAPASASTFTPPANAGDGSTVDLEPTVADLMALINFD